MPLSPSEISARLDALEDSTGQHADELKETQKDRQELVALRQEVAELRDLICKLAGATKYAEAIFVMHSVPNDRMLQDRAKFSQGLADIYTAASQRTAGQR